jgi:acetoin utilization deacetylase AcuC-like enzyme
MNNPPTRRVGFVTDERYFWHRSYIDFGPGVEDGPQLETPEARRRLLHLLDRSGLLALATRIPAVDLDATDLERVHDPDYLARLARDSDAGGGEAGEWAPFGPGSFPIARLAAGGAFAAMRAVLAGEVDTAFALVRPPGHHAERDRGRGYCLLANIPIAIRKLQAELGVRRVAVVDWDVHHGNGTQSLFWEDGDVLAISLHQDGLYPDDSGAPEETGAGDGAGRTINIPLPAGSGRGAYAAAFDEVVEPALRAFAPELIVVACGFDAGGMDPNGRMLLSAAAFAHLTRRLLAVADTCCAGRLAVIQEGGYSPLHMPTCGAALFAELLGVPAPLAGYEGGLDDLPDQALKDHQLLAVRRAREAARASGALPVFTTTQPEPPRDA